jgi:hypothetical protein
MTRCNYTVVSLSCPEISHVATSFRGNGGAVFREKCQRRENLERVLVT